MIPLESEGWRTASAQYVLPEIRRRVECDGTCDVTVDLVEWVWHVLGLPWTYGGAGECVRREWAEPSGICVGFDVERGVFTFSKRRAKPRVRVSAAGTAVTSG